MSTLSLTIHRGGPQRDKTWSGSVTLERLSVGADNLDKDALLLSSPSEVTFRTNYRGGRTPPQLHVYGISVPLETARAIVEAYCEKLAASPEIASDAQLNSLARPLRLLSTIIEAEGA